MAVQDEFGIKVNSIEDRDSSHGLTVSNTRVVTFDGATGANEIRVPNNLNDALSIESGAADLISFNTNTSTPSVTITPKTTVTGLLTASGGVAVPGNVNFAGGTTDNCNIVVLNNLAKGLVIEDNAGTEMMVFNTNASTKSITITPATTVTGAITANGGITLGANEDIVCPNAMIGTNNTQKIGFFGATPVVPQAHIANTDNNADNMMNTVNLILTRLETYGLLNTA